jgi:glycosyltransferase involved in cell wall biosynthesis
MEFKKRVCLMSVCHAPFDDRIYKKEALTLAKNGFEVYHVCYGNEEQYFTTDDHIHIIQLQKRRKGKSLKTVFAALQQTTLQDMFHVAKKLKADIYHLHDVELCRIVMQLKKLPQRPKVIYDAHEPYNVFLRESWHKRPFVRFLLNDLPAVLAENRILRKVDYLIATETNVADRFRKKNPHTAIVYNYSYFHPDDFPYSMENKPFDVIYCGSLSDTKGILLMLNVIAEAKKRGYLYRMAMIGNFHNPSVKKIVEQMILKGKLSDSVLFTGELPLHEVSEYYQQSKVAFCLFAPNRTNRLILPIKLFEYAAFGLPIIGSDFGHIAEIIKNNDIGVCVNPQDTNEATSALIDLLSEGKYQSYISKCINCVKTKYLWENQEEKLLYIFKQLLDSQK